MSSTGAIDANRLWVRKPDGSGDLNGSITLEYPQHPNVDVTWITPGEPAPEFNPSNGLTGEDIHALINNAGDIAQKVALGAAGVGIALGGVVVAAPGAHAAPSTGVSQIGGNTAAQAFANKMISTNTAAVVSGRRGEVSAAKTTACQVAQTRHAKAEKRAERTERIAKASGTKKAIQAAKKQVAKQARVVAKKCNAAGVVVEAPGAPGALPAGGVGYNLDGSVRMGPEYFGNGIDIKTPAAKAEYAKAVDAVSGVNWVDQSNVPMNERVGFPPGTPESLVAAAKANPGIGVSVMNYANAKVGDVFGGYNSEVIKTPEFVTAGNASAIRLYVKTDRSPSLAYFLIAMPDGSMRGTEGDDITLGTAKEWRLTPAGMVQQVSPSSGVVFSEW